MLPSTAFIFALPLLETLIVGLRVFGHSLRATTIISAIAFGSIFTLFSASALLVTEGSGLEYTMSLPISSKIIIRAKSLIATIVFLPVAVMIVALLALGRPSSWVLFLIPFLEIMAISAATTIQLSFFIQNYKKRGVSTGPRPSGAYVPRSPSLLSAGGLLRLVIALIVSGAIIAAPLAGYAVTYVL